MYQINPSDLFENLIKVYKELACAEDECRRLQNEIESYKPDSPKRAEIIMQYNEANERRINLSREYQIARYNVERAWMEIELAKLRKPQPID